MCHPKMNQLGGGADLSHNVYTMIYKSNSWNSAVMQSFKDPS